MNASTEAPECVAGRSASCSTPTATWIDSRVPRQRLTLDDVLVVAPYNTHVAILGSTPPAARRDLTTPAEVNRSRVI